MSRPPDHDDAPERDRTAWFRHRSIELIVSAVLVAATIVQHPSELVPDTKTDLVIDPGRFLRAALDLWDPSASFGRIQNQAVGYWFPMGPFFWLGDVLGVPPWLTQRLWWSAILLVAFWGLVKLTEAFAIGDRWTRLIGSMAFAAGPAILLELGSRSPNVLPTALLPFALLPLVRGAEGGSARRAAGVSALVILAMGGINATVTAVAMAVPALYLLTRQPGPRRRRLTIWWMGSVLAVTFWWWAPLLLQQAYSSFDILEYSETAATTTGPESLTEILRGTGLWLARLHIGGEAWLPAGVRLVLDNATIIATTLIAGIGVAGLASHRLRERAFLVLCLCAGVALMGAGYSGQLGGPLSGPVRDVLDGPLGAFRSVHKMLPLVALPLAIGLVHSLKRASDLLPRWRATRPAARFGPVLAGGGMLVVVVFAASPLWSRTLGQEETFSAIPEYWQDASAWLNREGKGERVLLVPASAFPSYDWGAPIDEPFQSLLDQPWAVRDIIPFGSLRSTRLLDGVEDVFHNRRPPAGLATTLARSGVGWVVVRNDLDLSRSTASPPVFVVDAMDRAPNIERVAGFGPAVTSQPTRERLTPQVGAGRPVQAVEIYRVGGRVERATIYDLDASLAVLGNAETTLRLSHLGVLDDRGLIVAGDDPDLAARAGRWVITDDFRRRDVAFSDVHDTASYTLQPGELAPETGDEPRDRLVPGDTLSESTIDLLSPIRSVEASSYFTSGAREPGLQPYAAVDGDRRSAWRVEAFRDPVGEWWELGLEEPTDVNSIEIRLPPSAPNAGYISEIRASTDSGSVDGSFQGPDDVLHLDLPEGRTRHVRVTIRGARPELGDVSTLGIAEISLDGISPTDRTVVTPAADRPNPATVVLARASADPFDATTGSEDTILDRLVDLPSSSTYQAGGEATIVAGTALDELVADVVGQTGDLAMEATSAWEGLPAFGAFRARDGDLDTAWIADIRDPVPAIALEWEGERTISGFRLTFPGPPVLRPETVQISVGLRTRSARVAPDGTVTFPTLVTDSLRIQPDLLGREDAYRGLVGISEIEMLTPDGEAPIPVAEAVDTAAVAVEVPCGSGPRLRIDGRPIATSVSGTLADLEQAEPLDLRICDPVTLAAGEHRIVAPSRGALQVDSLVLEPETDLVTDRVRSAEVLHWSPEDREVQIGSSDRATLLALSENRNSGWVATLDDQQLPATTVDGWRQAWVVPPGDGGVAHLEYRPGKTFDRMLAVGLLLVLAVAVTAAVPDRARRVRLVPVGPRPVPEMVTVVAGTVALALVAGPVAIAVPAMAIGIRRSTVRGIIGAVALATIGILMVLDSDLPGPEYAAIGQVLAGVALAAAVAGPLRRRDAASSTSQHSEPSARPR